MLDVLHVPAFKDNYIWMIRTDRRVAVIDPGDAAPVISLLTQEQLTPVAILCTHRHGDHTGGIAPLLAHYPTLPVYGPAHEPIVEITHPLVHDSELTLAALGIKLRVWETPGHTTGHIVFYGHETLFCGDVIFSAGCGRLLGGSAQQMYASLVQLASLPDNTAVYCTHEYTESNLRFAALVEPDNSDIRTHQAQVAQWRAEGRPSLPTTLAREKRINPFLRVHLPAIRAAVEKWAGTALSSDELVFSSLRRWKDEFRG
jgi:hydroxyacylglutathione hydrolase